METPAIRNVKLLPGAEPRLMMSAAKGVAPSEHTSIMVVAIKVAPSPNNVGPKYS